MTIRTVLERVVDGLLMALYWLTIAAGVLFVLAYLGILGYVGYMGPG